MKVLSLIKNERFKFIFGVFAFLLVVPAVASASMIDMGVMILKLFAQITGWAGIMLNMAIMELIFDMGNKMTLNIGLAVENAWSVVRDIMNLLFIFSLIYIGFLIILDISSSKARTLLPPLIIAALLINFSLFFTKTIIDVSNLAAVEIYQAVNWSGANPDSDTDPGTIEEGAINIGVSGAFMQIMGLKDLISPQNNSNNAGGSYSANILMDGACNAGNDDTWSCSATVLVYFLVTMIFFLVAAYAFAIGAFMLVWRFLVLIFLMIFSPVMFIGMIFPKAKKFQAKWWGTFLYSAFFAPAYMLMLYIAYNIASRVNVYDPSHNMFEAINGSYSSSDLILHFILVIGFLIGAVQVGKQMSFYGSNATLKFADNVRRRGQRALAAGTIGMGARLGRRTLGRGAQAVTDNKKLNKLATNGKGINRWLAKRALKNTAAVADSSFDARQMLSKKMQAEVGTGKKGGYSTQVKEHVKSEKAFADSLGEDKDVITAAETHHKGLVAAADHDVKSAQNDLQREINPLMGRMKVQREVVETGTKEQAERASAAIKAITKEIEHVERKHLPTIDAAKDTRKTATDNQKKGLAEAKASNQTAYAKNLNEAPAWHSWLAGTTKHADKQAAGAINKNLSDSDKQTNKIVDALKSSAKSSD